LPRLIAALASALVLSALTALAAAPAGAQMTEKIPQAIPSVPYDGVQHLRYRFGPLKIIPGANSIELQAADSMKPKVSGYITRFTPNLERADGTVPPVDELHLHHAVWLMRGYPTFAAGEEKTIFQFPKGYGYRYDPSDPWFLNHMIHNLLPNEDSAYITYDIDFVPLSSPAAATMQEAKPLWLDVAGLKTYPVFDVKRQWGGKDGKYTFPDDVRTPEERAKIGAWSRFRADRPMTLIGTAGHLHPGGLYSSMFVQRGAAKREVFRSEAKYWEPAGAVSWDVAMTATRPDWRVQLQPGDTVSVSATYDTRRSSWYESMGIMMTWYAEGAGHGGVDPISGPVQIRGAITHGHLPENDNHGGKVGGLPDARRLLSGTRTATVPIKDFVYARGDLSSSGAAARPPVVRPGQTLAFRNDDSDAQPIYHTITACKAPCNRTTGIAYPLANGPVDFDSGELGFGPNGLTAAAQRDTWKTPKTLKAGTYTYFCRIHPFMRGAFRVEGGKGSSKARKRSSKASRARSAAR
jgi:plastocyanin